MKQVVKTLGIMIKFNVSEYIKNAAVKSVADDMKTILDHEVDDASPLKHFISDFLQEMIVQRMGLPVFSETPRSHDGLELQILCSDDLSKSLRTVAKKVTRRVHKDSGPLSAMVLTALTPALDAAKEAVETVSDESAGASAKVAALPKAPPVAPPG